MGNKQQDLDGSAAMPESEGSQTLLISAPLITVCLGSRGVTGRCLLVEILHLIKKNPQDDVNRLGVSELPSSAAQKAL